MLSAERAMDRISDPARCHERILAAVDPLRMFAGIQQTPSPVFAGIASLAWDPAHQWRQRSGAENKAEI